MFELIHGDCLDILRRMPGRSIDCIFTDPPYIIGASVHGSGIASKRTYLRDIAAAGFHTGFDPILLDEFIRLLKAPNLFLFCSRLQLRDHLNWAHRQSLNWALLCWHKPNPIPLTAAPYLPDTEYILHFWKGAPIRGSYRSKRRFYVHPCSKNTLGHPTVKQLHIVKNLLLNAATAPGSVVLDPFMGSGTTGVAAIQLGHKFIGIELNGDYLAIAKRRIAQASPDFHFTIDLKEKEVTP